MIIYGAGSWAARFLRMYKNNTENIIGAAVTDRLKSESVVEGIEVKQIEEYISNKDRAFVIVAVDEKYQYEIEKHLHSLGFLRIHKTDRRKNELAEALVSSY